MWALPTCLPPAPLVIGRPSMFHHSESPEVIHAKLAEWEQTVATHRSQREADRLLAKDNDVVVDTAPSLIERIMQRLRPSARLHEQTGA